jgi:double-stranded RNA-binding protein Staufen
MKNFVTQCLVGSFKTEAEGNSKKLSKKRAADLMLKELRNLPSLPPNIPRPKTKPPPTKKKNRNLIKVSSDWIIVSFYPH